MSTEIQSHPDLLSTLDFDPDCEYGHLDTVCKGHAEFLAKNPCGCPGVLVCSVARQAVLAKATGDREVECSHCHLVTTWADWVGRIIWVPLGV